MISSEILTGIAELWMLLLFWSGIMLCVYSVRQKRQRRLLALVPAEILVYFLLQSATVLSVGFLFPAAAVLTVLWVVLFIESYHRQRGHLTTMSVKQAVDSLPVALCFYDTSGRVILKNSAMESLALQLTGEPLLDGNAFDRQIRTAYSQNTDDAQPLLHLPDGHTFTVSSETVTDRNVTLTMLTAADVTEEYRKTRYLRQQQDSIQALNERLTAYNRTIVSVISEREILNAKVRIHDELGLNLLMSKRYMLSGGTEEDKKILVSRLRDNLTCLLHEKQVLHADGYERILDTAEELNVAIRIHGKLPETDPNRAIVRTAMHECLTNTLRHAHGSVLNVTLTDTPADLIVRFTNDGIQPEEPIPEKGGLASLRRMTEQAGGSMKTDIRGGFSLELILKKGSHNDSV